jgi:hypothetical protein
MATWAPRLTTGSMGPRWFKAPAVRARATALVRRSLPVPRGVPVLLLDLLLGGLLGGLLDGAATRDLDGTTQ